MATLLGQGGALLGLGGPTGAPSGKMLEMAFSLDDPAFQGDHFRWEGAAKSEGGMRGGCETPGSPAPPRIVARSA